MQKKFAEVFKFEPNELTRKCLIPSEIIKDSDPDIPISVIVQSMKDVDNTAPVGITRQMLEG